MGEKYKNIQRNSQHSRYPSCFLWFGKIFSTSTKRSKKCFAILSFYCVFHGIHFRESQL